MSKSHTNETELAALGCALFDPGAVLPVAAANGLTPRLFTDLRCRAVSKLCVRMHDVGMHLESLLSCLRFHVEGEL